MDEFLKNLARLKSHYSTYVIFVFTSALSYWVQMPLDEQALYLSQWPILKMFAPGLGFVAFLIARGIPQVPKDVAP